MPDVLCSAGLRYNNLKIGDRRARDASARLWLETLTGVNGVQL
jgi:hypothetical protein